MSKCFCNNCYYYDEKMTVIVRFPSGLTVPFSYCNYNDFFIAFDDYCKYWKSRKKLDVKLKRKLFRGSKRL